MYCAPEATFGGGGSGYGRGECELILDIYYHPLLVEGLPVRHRDPRGVILLPKWRKHFNGRLRKKGYAFFSKSLIR